MLDRSRAPAADLYMAAGVSRLWRAADKGVLRPTHADDLIAVIPARLRDPENQWFGMAVMANVIVFSPSVVTPDEFGSYESLAEPRWRGQLCMTSSSLPDNNALIALMIHRHGHRQAELIVRQLLANFALPALRDPQALFAAMESAVCTVGIVSLAAAADSMAGNSASKSGIATPTLGHGGTQVDIAGCRGCRSAATAQGMGRPAT
jgi:iron(III) transport system substrate-binding protein